MARQFLYGGDYNPNQWPESTWDQDIALFQQAGINSATINVFSWVKNQPAEDVYDFSQLDRIVEKLCAKHIQIVMGTGTAAMPAWMFQQYPEVARVDYEGRRHKFGGRQNHCPNSLVYQKYAGQMAAKLAKRYGDNPNVVCWHVNNEYGGVCYCDNCQKAFRLWLRRRYGSLDALNRAWNTEVWGHTFTDWNQIVAPNVLGDGLEGGKTIFAGLSTDYLRFNSDSLLANFRLEKKAVRRYDAKTPITTNLMGSYKWLNYFAWAKEMDIVSWDNYPSYDTPSSAVAMNHDLMRGLKQKPFMLMEQTPSQQNWQPYNSLKKPGQLREQSYQAIAHGADTVQYFQLKQSIGGCEKFHGAVISHSGRNDTRVFKEVAQLGRELKHLPDIKGAQSPKEVGVLFDWENYWAYEFTIGPNQDLRYVTQIQQYYDFFYRQHVPVDMLADTADFSNYQLIVAPALYMVKPGVKEALESYVKAGGRLVLTTMSGLVDASDNVYLGGYPGPLRELAGNWVEEVDALAPKQHNEIVFADGQKSQANLVCDIMHPEGAKVLATYADNFYAGTPVVTVHQFGQGSVYYVGAILDTAGLDHVLKAAGLTPTTAADTDLEVTVRQKGAAKYVFILNPEGQAKPLPEEFAGQVDQLTGEQLTASQPVPGYAAYLLVQQVK